MLLSILKCTQQTDETTNTNIQLNTFVKGLQCWSGAYYVHMIFAIIKTVCFIILCLIVQMTYFETKSSSENCAAKSNSRSDVFLLISKIIICFIFIFFGESDNQWILIAILFFLSAFTFFSYYHSLPYYDIKVMKVKFFLI